MYDPELILDEPTSGLIVQQLVYSLDETRAAGRPSLARPPGGATRRRPCGAPAGGLVLEDTSRPRAHALCGSSWLPAAERVAGLPGVRELERRDRTIVFGLQGEPDALLKALANPPITSLPWKAARPIWKTSSLRSTWRSRSMPRSVLTRTLRGFAQHRRLRRLHRAHGRGDGLHLPLYSGTTPAWRSSSRATQHAEGVPPGFGGVVDYGSAVELPPRHRALLARASGLDDRRCGHRRRT